MTLPRIVRFLAVGAVATGCHAGCYLAALASGMPAQAANILAFAIAFAVSYLGQARYTFAARPDLRTLLRYLVVQCGGCALNALWVHLVERSGHSPQWAVLPIALATPWVVFAGCRWWVFAGRTPAEAAA